MHISFTFNYNYANKNNASFVKFDFVCFILEPNLKEKIC